MKKILAVFMLIFIAGSVNAQSLAIGVQGGYVKPQDAEALIMPSAAVRLGLGGLKVEGSIGYKTAKYDEGLTKTTSYPVLLTAFLNFLPIVHIEGGIGWYNTKVEFSGMYSSFPSQTFSEIGYHAGAGVELPLGNLLLTGDIRYVIEKTKFSKINSTGDIKSDFYTIVVGLMFKLY